MAALPNFVEADALNEICAMVALIRRSSTALIIRPHPGRRQFYGKVLYNRLLSQAWRPAGSPEHHLGRAPGLPP